MDRHLSLLRVDKFMILSMAEIQRLPEERDLLETRRECLSFDIERGREETEEETKKKTARVNSVKPRREIEDRCRERVLKQSEGHKDKNSAFT